MSATLADCPLCLEPGGEVLWRDALCRVVRVAGAEHPDFCRVIWKQHVREMTDLDAADRRHLLAVVFAVEAALRTLVRPDKINLASLGNQVPHLHWHVIPRFRDDRHFPEPIWARPLRDSGAHRTPTASRAIHDEIVAALAEEQAG